MTVSLRTRLLAGIIIATAVLLSVFSVVVYTVTRQSMIQNFDTSLLSSARMLSAVIEDEGEHDGHDDDDENEDYERYYSRNGSQRGITFEFDVRMMPEFNRLNGGGYYQIWGRDGLVLVRSPSLDEQNLAYFKSDSNVPVYRDMRLPDTKQGRAVSYPFLPRADDELSPNELQQDRTLTLVLARNSDQLYSHLSFLKWLLAGASVGVIFLSTGVGFVVTRTGLRPIHALARAITSVREDNLGLEFPSEQYPPELAPVCQCLNDVFGRLEESFRREKQPF